MAGQFDDTQEDKTEKPTSFRREEFRKQGSVAMSREVVSIVLLLAVWGMAHFFGHTLLSEFKLVTERYFRFDGIGDLGREAIQETMLMSMRSWIWMAAPIFAAVMVAGVLACGLQVGFQITWEPLTPKWDRLDPTKGVKRILSLQGATEAFKSFIKLGVAGVVVWFFLKSRAAGISNILGKDVSEIAVIYFSEIGTLFLYIVLSMVFMAALDYAVTRFRLEKQMMMSRREVKEEYKMREGDPLLKQRVKNIQRRIAMQRMMEAVPKADVVVTNPTHISVALRYDMAKMAAPKVVAKGVDDIAMKIREVAKKHGVPLVENRPLARALHKQVDIGKTIVPELYKAVAEVISYVYRLRQGQAGATA